MTKKSHLAIATRPCARCGKIIPVFWWGTAPVCVACEMRDIEMARLERKYEND